MLNCWPRSPIAGCWRAASLSYAIEQDGRCAQPRPLHRACRSRSNYPMVTSAPAPKLCRRRPRQASSARSGVRGAIRVPGKAACFERSASGAATQRRCLLAAELSKSDYLFIFVECAEKSNLTFCSCQQFFKTVELPLFFGIVSLATLFTQRRISMKRTAFAIAVAAVVFAAASGVSRAAPIAPLPAGVASEAAAGDVTHVWCRWGRCGWGWRGSAWCRWHPYRCGW